MRLFYVALIVCLLLAMFAACSQAPGGGSDTTPPATPNSISVSTSQSQVTLIWTENNEADLKGYNLYWGSAADALNDTLFIAKPASSQTITDLSNGSTYFFALDAQDEAGNHSSRSETMSAVPGSGADTTKPTLVSSTPAHNDASVSVNVNALVFTFSEAMNTSTVTLSSPDYDITQLTATWNTEYTSVSYTQISSAEPLPLGLEYLKLYTFTITGKDPAGNEGTGTVSFTTESDTVKPRAVSSTPANNETSVPMNSSIVVTFSEAMDRASVEANFNIVANVTCDFAWSSNDSTVICTPQSPLAEKTTYTVTFGTEVKDKAGNVVELMNEQPFSFSFITGTAPDTTAPTVLSFLPDPGARGLSPGGTIIAITFSEAMNLASLEQALTGTVNTLSDSKPLVISSVIPDQDVQGYGYIFYLQNALDYNMVIQWTIGTNATDLAGNPLAQARSSTFSLMRKLMLTLPANPDLSGYIVHSCWNGDCNNTIYRNKLFVGIRGNPLTIGSMRAFIGFDLPTETLLNAKAILSAVLTLEQTEIYGDPFNPNNLSSMALERVDYGTKFRLDDFETEPLNCDGSVCSRDFYSEAEANGPVDVLKFVLADLAEGDVRGNRSEYRLRFANNKSQNGSEDAHVSYTFPTLTITYLIP
jgi:Bacterial Ig-like domain